MKIDSFIYHLLDRKRRDDSIGGTYDEVKTSKTRIPFLLKVTTPSWKPNDVPDLVIISRLNRIFACTGTRLTFNTLLEDPEVESIESSREGTILELNNSVPFVLAHNINNSPIREKGDKALIAICGGPPGSDNFSV